MHNLKELRKNLDFLKEKFDNRNVDFDLADFNKKDSLNRDLIIKKEKLEQEKKSLSKSKDKANFEKSKKISLEISELIKKQTISQSEIDKIIFSLPNFAHEDVPVGKCILFPGQVTHGHTCRELVSGVKYSLTMWTSRYPGDKS